MPEAKGYILRECPKCYIRVVVGENWEEARSCTLCHHVFEDGQLKVKKSKTKSKAKN